MLNRIAQMLTEFLKWRRKCRFNRSGCSVYLAWKIGSAHFEWKLGITSRIDARMARWQNGRMAGWPNGRMAGWKNGRIWQDGTTDLRRNTASNVSMVSVT